MQLSTLSQWLAGIAGAKDRTQLRGMISPLADRCSSNPINSAGLAIKTGGSPTVKTGASDFYAVVNGVTVKIAAATDMPALTGTITAAYFNNYCFFVNSGGTVSLVKGTEGATLAAMKWPQFPQQKAWIGSVIITYGSTFTGGTTPLDTATTVYVNGLPGVDPWVLLGNP